MCINLHCGSMTTSIGARKCSPLKEGSPHRSIPLAASQACINFNDLPSFRAVSAPILSYPRWQGLNWQPGRAQSGGLQGLCLGLGAKSLDEQVFQLGQQVVLVCGDTLLEL